ncbi:hypothetical protein [Roseateles puraquae]|nr:hypothetical protein [Roseateles puraquae]MDG0853332.1 hypothetical protein [Roseateles puraquae]
MTDVSSQPSAAGKKPVGRGVSYPFISLEVAVEKARAFHREERKSAAPVSSAMRHFGYSETSSGGRQTVATLLQFGLLEDEGRSENRHVKLTERALDILLAEPESPARYAALREAVRMPKLYANIMAKWPDQLPSDHTLAFYLQKEFDFNPKNIKAFIADLRASLAFARYSMSDADEPLSQDERESQSQPVEDAAEDVRPSAVNFSPKSLPPQSPKQQLTSPEMPNEREWLRGMLSKDGSSAFRILVSGDISAKAIGKLIRILDAQKMVLEDDDEEDDR